MMCSVTAGSSSAMHSSATSSPRSGRPKFFKNWTTARIRLLAASPGSRLRAGCMRITFATPNAVASMNVRTLLPSLESASEAPNDSPGIDSGWPVAWNRRGAGRVLPKSPRGPPLDAEGWFISAPGRGSGARTLLAGRSNRHRASGRTLAARCGGGGRAASARQMWPLPTVDRRAGPAGPVDH
jgi:hypothetical protein